MNVQSECETNSKHATGSTVVPVPVLTGEVENSGANAPNGSAKHAIRPARFMVA